MTTTKKKRKKRRGAWTPGNKPRVIAPDLIARVLTEQVLLLERFEADVVATIEAIEEAVLAANAQGERSLAGSAGVVAVRTGAFLGGRVIALRLATLDAAEAAGVFAKHLRQHLIQPQPKDQPAQEKSS